MKQFILTVLFFLSAIAIASPLTLKESLGSSEPGSYLVTQQGKNYDFLYIRDLTPTHVILEEVAIPCSSFARSGLSWRVWFEQGAPGNTLWTISQINIETGHFEEIFSFTHQGWVDLSDQESFFATLLNLSFNELPEGQRKKVGLAPGRNKPDHRPLWSPKAIYEGRPLGNVSFKAYTAQWPHDKSEMADRLIEVYLPENNVDCPSFFPYWVEVEGRVGSAKMRVVDSGKGIHSPRSNYPKRPVAARSR